MEKFFLTLVFGLLPYGISVAQTMVYRSEYEQAGDQLYDLNDLQEGLASYTLISGNDDGYYALDNNSGIISVARPIPDAFDIIRRDTLVVGIDASIDTLIIVDAYDYFIQQLSPEYEVMDQHGEYYVDSASQWTAYNNLWGRGTAVPGQDFRIATIHKSSVPDTTFIIWDVPGLARDYGGSSVWCYSNVFWGNRYGMRENLQGFPFQIASIDSLELEFDFDQLFGDDQFKIAMNMFMTDESYLTNFSANDGDLFFVFDQKGTWIPNYPYALPDTIILGKLFALRYDDSLRGRFYERRRVIIKDNERLMSGTLDLKGVFNRFIVEGYLNPQQYIYHIQLGVEVTAGFGAIAIRHGHFKFIQNQLNTGSTEQRKYLIYPNPSEGEIIIKGSAPPFDIEIFDITEKRIRKFKIFTRTLNIFNLPAGIYTIKINGERHKLIKR